jgi:hypothetical protein
MNASSLYGTVWTMSKAARGAGDDVDRAEIDGEVEITLAKLPHLFYPKPSSPGCHSTFSRTEL